jgi:hypothetical protein
LKKFENFLFFALLQINIFLVFLDHFDPLISKIILKKYYFDIFVSEKYFERQPQPHSQTGPFNRISPMYFSASIEGFASDLRHTT